VNKFRISPILEVESPTSRGRENGILGTAAFDSIVSGFERPALLNGWGMVIHRGDERTLVSAGMKSEVGFLLPAKKTTRLTFVAIPIRDAGLDLSPQIMTIQVNGRPLAMPIVLINRARIRLRIPKRATVEGLNILTFTYARVEPTYRFCLGGGIFQTVRRAVAYSQLEIR
jgi:hypothetical protein